MRTAVLATLALGSSAVGLVIGSTQTSAEILRCEATKKNLKGMEFHVRLDITLPDVTEYDDSVLTLTDRKTEKFRGIVMMPDEVGLGKIEVRDAVAHLSLSRPKQHTLLVTARPVTAKANDGSTAHYPLVAVFFEGGRDRWYPSILQVDYWKKGKPFIYTASGGFGLVHIEQYRGTCE